MNGDVKKACHICALAGSRFYIRSHVLHFYLRALLTASSLLLCKSDSCIYLLADGLLKEGFFEQCVDYRDVAWKLYSPCPSVLSYASQTPDSLDVITAYP